MSAKKKSNDETPDFETAMQKLEKIVTDLDQGHLSLENSLSSFEEGMRLARVCEKKLEEASGRVEKIMKDFSGGVREIPLTSAEKDGDDHDL